jgi:hypothetical protein
MKRLTFSLLFLAIMLFSINNSFAQIKDVANMLSGIEQAPEDVNKLFQGYVSPYANAIGANLNAGWYNTAKVHKLGGFDLTATFNFAFVPDLDKTFDLSKLDLTGTVEGNPIAPTAAGERQAGPTVAYYVNDPRPGNNDQFKLAEFKTPQGTGLGFLPTPMLQLGIGLIKGTEITGRYMPTLSLGDNTGELGLWGIAVKHSIKQWIPVLEKIPVLQLSAFGGYTSFSSAFNLSFKPEDLSYGDIVAVDNTTDAVTFDNQEMILDITSFTASVLVSANLPVVCFYGGIGFATTNTDLKLNGYFPTPVPYIDNANVGIQVTDASVVENPLNINIKNKEGGKTDPRLNVGMRIKLGIITFHGDYTYSNYSIVTGGIGISFR